MGDLRKLDKLDEWDFMMDKANKIGYIRITAFTETLPPVAPNLGDAFDFSCNRG